ncbi:MAG: DUF1565 domain-containing protein [Saprospiraceae bacterium]|nr:DUF1565 domain-containing protein [Saprospiraceae bacterium]
MRIKHSLFFCLLSSLATAKSFYVSTNGNDLNKGNHWFVPFKTLEKAQDAVRPGDTVHIMRGDYYAKSAFNFEVTRNGTEGKWIVYKNYLNHKPVLYSGSKGVIHVKSSHYISFEGLILDVKNDWIDDAETNLQTGIAIQGVYEEPASHIKIYNCFIKNFKGPAIALENYDFITLSYNRFYNNAWDSKAAAVVLFTKAVETQSTQPYRNYIQSNVFEKNSISKTTSQPVCNPVIKFEYSKSSLLPDQKHALIYNNILYTNGGGGISIENGVAFLIMNNTHYKNAQQDSCEMPEIVISQSTNVLAANNIFFTSSAKPAGKIFNSVNTQFKNNLYYNFSSKESGENDIIADPEFELIDMEKNEYNFRLKGNSPAINAGIDEKIADIDFEGNPRKFDLHTDLGAIEFMQRTLPSLKNLKAGPQSNKLKTYWSSLYLQAQKVYTLWNQEELPFTIRIYDPMGVLIHQDLFMGESSSSYEFDFSRYPNGIYTVVALSNAGNYFDRVKIFPMKQQ